MVWVLFSPFETDFAHLEEVDKSARCGDDNLAAVLNVAQLRSLGGTAENAGVAQPRRGTKLNGHLLNLLSQLPDETQYVNVYFSFSYDKFFNRPKSG